MSSPGWYQDPDREGWRWWDGTAWGPRHSGEPDESNNAPAARTSKFGTFKLGIDFDSGWALRLSKLVAVVAGCAATVAATVILYTFVVGALPDGMSLLLLPALPILIVGQLWCIAVLLGRVEARNKAMGGSARWPRNYFRFRDLRGGLSRPAAALFLLLFYGAVFVGPGFSFWGSSTLTPTGVPTDDPSTCEYSSNNHGEYSCLTRSEFERKQVAEQRFAAGAFLGFFIAHCGLSSGEVLRHRQLAAAAEGSEGPE